LTARWIEETHDEYCLRCRQRKRGRFLIIDLPNQRYMAICEDCIKE